MHVNKIFVVVVLLLATIALFKGFQRYQPAGLELLRNGSFEQGLEGWTELGGEGAASVGSGVVLMVNHDPSHSVGIRQALHVSPEHKNLMLTADISTENIEPGTKSWETARIIILGRNAQGKLPGNQRHHLARITGSNSWQHYSDVFFVVDNATEVVVTVQLARSTGVMRVRNLSLIPVTERDGFRVAAYGLLAIWCATLLWAAIPVFRGVRSRLAQALLSLVVLATMIVVLVPNSVKQVFLEPMRAGYAKLHWTLSANLPWIEGLGWGELEYLGGTLDKGIHFALFAVLTVVIRFARPTDHGATQLICLFIFSAVTEVLQFFAIGREPKFGDWLVDASGVFLAFVLFEFFRRKRTSAGT